MDLPLNGGKWNFYTESNGNVNVEVSMVRSLDYEGDNVIVTTWGGEVSIYNSRNFRSLGTMRAES